MEAVSPMDLCSFLSCASPESRRVYRLIPPRGYLIFSHRGRGQYRISRKPFSDWQTPENPDIPCESVPKMALWNGRILFTGFHRIEGYAGTLTFTEAWQDPDGSLRF